MCNTWKERKKMHYRIELKKMKEIRGLKFMGKKVNLPDFPKVVLLGDVIWSVEENNLNLLFSSNFIHIF